MRICNGEKNFDGEKRSCDDERISYGEKRSCDNGRSFYSKMGEGPIDKKSSCDSEGGEVS